MTKTVYGRDRQGNPSAATITIASDAAPPMNHTFPEARLEIRGTSYLSMAGSHRKTLWKVYLDGSGAYPL